MREDDLVRLRAMHDAAKRALTFADGKNRADLTADLTLQLFTKKALEIIATAASKTTKECKKRHGDFPWGAASQFGKRPAKRKGSTEDDLDRMWAIVTSELPRLEGLLEGMLAQENGSDQTSAGG